MKVREVMTTPAISAPADTPAADLAALLRQHQVTAVPIVDDEGGVLGVVSEYDLLARAGPTAADVMSTAVVSVSEETDVDDVRALLIDRRIHRLPVLSGHRLVGIVSRSDLVALLLTEWTCAVCGEAVRSHEAPSQCPRCSAPASRFAEQEQPPGD
jgi:CBS domain-containing protein